MKKLIVILSLILALCFIPLVHADDLCTVEGGTSLLMVTTPAPYSMFFTEVFAPSTAKARVSGPPSPSIIKYLTEITGKDYSKSRVGQAGFAFIILTELLKDCVHIQELEKDIPIPPKEEIKPRPKSPEKERKMMHGNETA